MATKSFWFTHDFAASEDPKMLFLRQALGIEGVGIFWFLIEKLAQNNGKLPLKIIPLLSSQMMVTEPKVIAVIHNFELFEIVEETFFSQRLLLTLESKEQMSAGGKAGALKRWGNKEQIKIELK